MKREAHIPGTSRSPHGSPGGRIPEPRTFRFSSPMLSPREAPLPSRYSSPSAIRRPTARRSRKPVAVSLDQWMENRRRVHAGGDYPCAYDLPVFIMSYANIVFCRGVAQFVEDAARSRSDRSHRTRSSARLRRGAVPREGSCGDSGRSRGSPRISPNSDSLLLKLYGLRTFILPSARASPAR